MSWNTVGKGTYEVKEWVEDGSVWVILFWLFIIVCVVRSCSGG